MISARDELKHHAESLTEGEAEVYMAGPALLAVCRALIDLADQKDRMYDTTLQELAEQAREAVHGLPGTKPEPPAVCPCGDPNCPNPGDCDAMSRDANRRTTTPATLKHPHRQHDPHNPGERIAHRSPLP